MAFLLQDGALYVPTKRAFDIWDTLIANPNACDMDRKVGGLLKYLSLSSLFLCALLMNGAAINDASSSSVFSWRSSGSM